MMQILYDIVTVYHKSLKGAGKVGKEIERKFRVQADWQPQGAGVRIAQGYLCAVPERTVRVRVRGGRGYLTVKGKNEGISRAEFEYEVPLADAEAMLQLCEQPLIEKTRYLLPQGELCWEVDVFAGANEGLIVAEIELPSPDTPFARPAWLGEEVSDDPRYYNSSLQRHPYKEW